MGYWIKLAAMTLVSSIVAVTVGSAHEVQPTIGDLTVRDGEMTLVLDLNLEAFLAEIDLDGLEDTDDAENAAGYDALRALPDADILSQAPALLEGWNALPLIAVDGAPVVMRSGSASVPEQVSEDLPRVSRWELVGDVPAGAQTVEVRWPSGAGALVLRQQGVDEPFTGLLEGGQSSPAIALGGGNAAGGWETFAAYIPVGFDHILPKGLDHILFVLGLFFLSTRLGPLLWQVSAFTLAHTVTLALGALGWVTISGAIVEPLIAASIVYVAVENVFSSQLNRWRPAIVFAFGLLHGLGFASVLGDFGLPQGQFIPALIGFNIGVELGQLTVIALAAVVIWVAVRAAGAAQLSTEEEPVRSYAVTFRAVSLVGSLVIAVIGVWWVIERVFL